MFLVPILESKSQNGTQIFKSLKMVPFLLKRLTFALPVKSRFTSSLEGVPRVSDSDTCQYYATCHFVSLNLIPLF